MNRLESSLVLTGAAEYWPDSTDHSYLLGPWCLASNAQHGFEEQERFRLVPSPFRKPADLVEATRYVGCLVERVIGPVGDMLEEWHSVDLGTQYWRISTLNWLVHWVGVCWDRYRRLEFAQSLLGSTGNVRVVVHPRAAVATEDWGAFMSQVVGHSYNLCLLSDLIRMSEHWRYSATEGRMIDGLGGACRGGRNSPPTQERRKELPLGCRVWQRLMRRTDGRLMLGNVHGMSRRDKVVIQWALDPLALLRGRRRNGGERGQSPGMAIPGLSRVAEHPRKDRTLEGPSPRLRFMGDSHFEDVIAELLPRYLPRCYLDRAVSESAGNGQVRVWVGSESYGEHGRLRGLAGAVANGAKWLCPQHGGNYGQTLAFPLSQSECEAADAFLSWGWTHRQGREGRIVPLPSPMLSKLPRHRSGGDDVVFVGTMMPAYPYRFHSVLQPENLLEYLAWRERFLRAASTAVHDRLCFRPYGRTEYGVDELGPLRRAAPGCRILREGNLAETMARARLVIVDHLATTLLQALAMDVPTVAYWDAGVFALDSAVREDFDALGDVGLLWHSPEAAAGHVSAVVEAPERWWRSAAVEEVKRRFRGRFALSSRRWRRDWVKFLRMELRAMSVGAAMKGQVVDSRLCGCNPHPGPLPKREREKQRTAKTPG